MIARLEKDHLNLNGPSMTSGLPPTKPNTVETCHRCRDLLRKFAVPQSSFAGGNIGLATK